MKMNTSRIILLSVITILASICVGVVIAQPSSSTNPVVRTLTVSPYLPANGTNPGNQTVISTPLPIPYPYPYPYVGDNYLVQMITQLLTTAKDGTYTGLSVSTQNGVTTIMADEVTATSNSFSLHLVGFKGVIDSNKNVVSVTASLIDYKDGITISNTNGTTSFYGKDVSFTSPIYPTVYNQGVVIPPTPAAGK